MTRRATSAEARGTPTSAADLAEHDCLAIRTDRAPATEWPLRKGGAVEVRPTLQSNDMQLVRQAALEGLGVALSPTYAVVLDLVAEQLVPVLPEVGREASLVLLTTRCRAESARLQVFFEVLEAIAAKLQRERAT